MWCTRLDRDKERHTTMNVDPINTDNSTALHATRMAVRESGAVTDMADNLADSATAYNQQPTGVWNRTAFRHIYPHALFNKSPQQLRRIGALGGKAYGRNQRARRALMPTPPAAIPLRDAARAKHRRRHGPAGRPVSLASLRRATTLLDGAIVPAANTANIRIVLRWKVNLAVCGSSWSQWRCSWSQQFRGP